MGISILAMTLWPRSQLQLPLLGQEGIGTDQAARHALNKPRSSKENAPGPQSAPIHAGSINRLCSGGMSMLNQLIKQIHTDNEAQSNHSNGQQRTDFYVMRVICALFVQAFLSLCNFNLLTKHVNVNSG